MTDLPALFAQVASDAMALDLRQLRSTIRLTADDGLRATRYDGTGRGGSGDSHPERQALHARTDPSWADLAAVDRHEARYIAAIAELAVRSHSHGTPDTWDEAVQDAHLLATMTPSAIEVLDRTGQRPARWIHQAGDAIHDLEAIASRHMTRVPTDFDRLHESVNDATCRNHTQIGRREKRATRMLCDWCYRHVGDLELAGLGPAVDLQHDPAMWPSEGMMRAEGRVALGRERRDWLAGHGLNPLDVDRLRARRRAG